MMKNKTLILKILLIVFCCFSTAYCGAIEILFNNKEQLAKRAVVCIVDITETTKRDFTPRGNHLIREMSGKNLEEWKKREFEVFDAFLDLYRQSTYMVHYCQEEWMSSFTYDMQFFRLGDTFLIALLVETLGELPSALSMDERIEDIFKSLPYPYLKPYRTKIINKLKQVDNISRFSYLAAIIDPPADIKNKLLALPLKNLSFGLRARLGDKEIERILIERVEKAVKISTVKREKLGDGNYLKKFSDSMFVANVNNRRYPIYKIPFNKVIDELFLCGTNECLKTAVTLFAEYQPELGPEGCYSVGGLGHRKTLRRLIIDGFRIYHPEQPLLHAEYDKVSYHYAQHASAGSEEVIAKYLEKVVNWGNKEYGTNARLKDKILFSGQCDMEIYSRTRKEKK
ncbi:MAG: hypothetical protein LBI42_09480 [Chitinispirillales bacterium]|nr:hypothetical protein [Chitinispirillales bacterium]